MHSEEGIDLDKRKYESKNSVLTPGFPPGILQGHPMTTVSTMALIVVVVHCPSELVVV